MTLLLFTIIFYSATPVLALDLKFRHEISINKSDSTKARDKNGKTSKKEEQKRETQSTKSESNLAYNIIYYLIANFIKNNSINRSK